ncbi:unnamed protein product [Amoebophrya sp. A120]|nr:unnamed protein product [Amoebophrya sp. A120]|eukprot:GSA120T00016231001.1
MAEILARRAAKPYRSKCTPSQFFMDFQALGNTAVAESATHADAALRYMLKSYGGKIMPRSTLEDCKAAALALREQKNELQQQEQLRSCCSGPRSAEVARLRGKIVAAKVQLEKCAEPGDFSDLIEAGRAGDRTLGTSFDAVSSAAAVGQYARQTQSEHSRTGEGHVHVRIQEEQKFKDFTQAVRNLLHYLADREADLDAIVERYPLGRVDLFGQRGKANKELADLSVKFHRQFMKSLQFLESETGRTTTAAAPASTAETPHPQRSKIAKILSDMFGSYAKKHNPERAPSTMTCETKVDQLHRRVATILQALFVVRWTLTDENGLSLLDVEKTVEALRAVDPSGVAQAEAGVERQTRAERSSRPYYARVFRRYRESLVLLQPVEPGEILTGSSSSRSSRVDHLGPLSEAEEDRIRNFVQSLRCPTEERFQAGMGASQEEVLGRSRRQSRGPGRRGRSRSRHATDHHARARSASASSVDSMRTRSGGPR